jgi:antirestriction protein
MKAQNEKLNPRIYVACLAAYNNGVLHGRWIDAAQSEEEIRAEIASMLKASPIPDAEEFAIHDYEEFGGARVEEYSGIQEVAQLAGFVSEHGELGGAVLAHFGDIDTARSALEENYAGAFPSLADYVQELTEETTTIPQTLRYYLDWESMARDAELNGDFFTVELVQSEVHVFWQR